MLNLLSNNSSDIADPTSLSPLPSDPAGQLDILGHNGDPLGMNGTQVCVLKQPNKEGDSETGFEPLIDKPNDGRDGNPSTINPANRIASFRRARFSSFGSPYLLTLGGGFLDRGCGRDPRL
ncbi:hypothetical protein OIU77_026408 [Salix suchowensis]|uniref:Uncharacterized protein n=1 Tax=Salix suchowensis TaxID=1278906 RepID=A0ABQ9BLI0_9ROSI|nr:hypothetical protein OIU77_026408 [Salix suchowensis]